MTPRDRDADVVRSAISELRAADERQAPGFTELLSRASRRDRQRRTLPLARLALAAALLIAAVLGYRASISRGPKLVLPREVAALSTWRPVTDVLLETPGRGLLRSESPLGESIINVYTKGERR